MRQINLTEKLLVITGLIAFGAVAQAQESQSIDTITAQSEPVTRWQPSQLIQLRQWLARAPEDALPTIPTTTLDAAQATGDPAGVGRAATALALRLARIHLLGAARATARTSWRIIDTDASVDLESWLARALASDGLGAFFSALRPKHPQYALLRAALAKETDAQRRKAIAGNMERWRWMPRDLGQDYVLVNAANFTAGLWREGRQTGEWRVIVGKRSTPTPVFSATITGVIFNPWWEIPASIVREKRGNFPARLGYVRSGDRYRQRPGPNNALGQMKLVMPNPYRVYMHDTPGKQLFEKEERAFSHGCIRTADALGFAATLLKGVKTREEIDAIVASRKTTQVDLPAGLPVYVTYFTATAAEDGTVWLHDDIYNRDQRLPALALSETTCSVPEGEAAG